MQRRQFAQSVLGSFLVSQLVDRSLATDRFQEKWPGWRGVHRDGKSTARQWPQSLDEDHLKLSWEIPLDLGYSGPIVDGQNVYVTETVGKKSESVRALDRASGEQKWTTSWEGAMSVPFFAKSNGDWIRSTPACDGQRLYVAGMRDVLVALNIADGSEAWKVDFPKQFGSELPSFGFVCSPLVDGDWLYVQAGGGVCKLKAATGELVWKKLDDGGGMNGSAFSSPILATLHDRLQLLVQTRTTLVGLDPESGETLWSKPIEAFRGMNILTPTVYQNSIFTSSYGGKSWRYDFGPKQGPWDVAMAWENKVQGYMSSPILIGSHLFLHLRNQRFVCIDMESGKELWTTRPFGKYWSMVSNGEQILALDEQGKLFLIDADPTEFRMVSERKVSEEESWAHLAVVDDQVFVRHLKGLSVYQWT
jgi:outer membrane protein assembly factor BamB